MSSPQQDRNNRQSLPTGYQSAQIYNDKRGKPGKVSQSLHISLREQHPPEQTRRPAQKKGQITLNDIQNIQIKNNEIPLAEDEKGLSNQEIALKRAFKKAEAQTLETPPDKIAKKQKEPEYKFFYNMPKHLRIEIKQDILTTHLKNKNEKLSAIPKQWMKPDGDTEHKISSDVVSREISDEISRLKGNNENDYGLLANDVKNNALSTLIHETQNYNDEFACHMWYPKERKLIKVEYLKIYKHNAKFLQVTYNRPKKSKEQGNDEATAQDQHIDTDQQIEDDLNADAQKDDKR